MHLWRIEPVSRLSQLHRILDLLYLLQVAPFSNNP